MAIEVNQVVVKGVLNLTSPKAEVVDGITTTDQDVRYVKYMATLQTNATSN